MDLEQCRDFLALARELSFSRAAEARHVTQPAFSRRIRTLERAVGVRLVERTSRSVALTAAGEAFLPHATALVRLAADARAAAQAAAGEAERRLSLAATHALSHRFVPEFLMRLVGAEGIQTLNMISDTQQQSVQHMLGGGVDFFICHTLPGQDVSGLPPRQFRHAVIGRDRLVPLCAVDPAPDPDPDPDAGGRPVWSLDGATQDQPFIAYGAASGLSRILDAAWAAGMRPPLKPCMQSVLAATNMEMARQRQGIAYLPLSLALPLLETGELTRAGGPGFDVPVEIVIFRPRARLSPHAEAFWQRVADTSMQDAHE